MAAAPSFSGPLLVTGARGRLATILAGHYAGRKPRLFSRESGGQFEDLSGLLDPGAYDTGGALLHLAWSTLPATSEQAQGREWQSDLPYIEQLLDTMATLPDSRRPHFVFFSTGGAVYGNAPGRPNREDDPCVPIGWYGRGKRAAEQLILERAASHGLPATILRISNPYGYPVPAERAQGIIPHAIRCAREQRTLTLWGDGHAAKDFLHYTDFLAALDHVLARRLTGTFNLCHGESHSVLEIIALVEKHTGARVTLARTPGPAWDVTDSRLSPERLCAATGWRPAVKLDEGIRRAVAGV
jgi:UDP-glucose 4-epimerase